MPVPRALAPCLLVLLPGCSLFGGDDDGLWIERSLAEAPPQRDLLGYCARGMSQAGYPAPEILDATSGVRSAWRTELQPFGGTGSRRRAHLRIETGETGEVVLQARVEVEINEELARPLDLAEADWKAGPDDATGARILLQHVVALLEASGVGGARR